MRWVAKCHFVIFLAHKTESNSWGKKWLAISLLLSLMQFHLYESAVQRHIPNNSSIFVRNGIAGALFCCWHFLSSSLSISPSLVRIIIYIWLYIGNRLLPVYVRLCLSPEHIYSIRVSFFVCNIDTMRVNLLSFNCVWLRAISRKNHNKVYTIEACMERHETVLKNIIKKTNENRSNAVFAVANQPHLNFTAERAHSMTKKSTNINHK